MVNSRTGASRALSHLRNMDRTMQLRHLEEAKRHIAEGRRHISEQELDIDGHATQAAHELLVNLRAIQALHIEHRNRTQRDRAVSRP